MCRIQFEHSLCVESSLSMVCVQDTSLDVWSRAGASPQALGAG